MAFGQRKSDRVHFQHDHSVNLMAVDGTWRRGCVLKDISATGARLEVEGSTEVLKAREILHGAVVNWACVSSVRAALGEWLSGWRRVRCLNKTETKVVNAASPNGMKLICKRRVPCLDSQVSNFGRRRKLCFETVVDMFFTLPMEHRIPHAKSALSRSLCVKLCFG